MEGEQELPGDATSIPSTADVLERFATAQPPAEAIYRQEAVRNAGGIAVDRAIEADEELPDPEPAKQQKGLRRIASLATSGAVERVRDSRISLPLQGMATELARSARRSRVAPRA